MKSKNKLFIGITLWLLSLVWCSFWLFASNLINLTEIHMFAIGFPAGLNVILSALYTTEFYCANFKTKQQTT